MVATLTDDATDIRVRLRRRSPLLLEGSGMTDDEFPNDQSLPELREKMDEYMACGCRLGWLIDPQKRRTYVYSENGDIQTVPFEGILSGGEVMPGLELRLAEVLG